MSVLVKPSLAKLIANRSNARKSRGPRTAGGKARASRNALRHGLAATIHRNPHFFPQVESMARAMSGDDKDALLMEQALVIAENHLILESVRTESIAAIERLRDKSASPLTRDDSLQRAKLKFRVAKAEYARRVEAKNEAEKRKAEQGKAEQGKAEQGKANGLAADGLKAMAAKTAQARKSKTAADHTGQREMAAERNEFDAMCLAMPDLLRLDRYARRACWRRNQAIDRFIAIKARSGAGPSTNE